MKRQILISSLILLFMAAFATADDLPYKEGELLVRFANFTLSTTMKNSILSSALSCSCSPVVKEYSVVPGLTLIEVPTGITTEQGRVLLNQSSDILYAAYNYELELSIIPNDTRFSELWGLDNTGQAGGSVDADIDAPEAWDMQTGSSSIIVAVTDTGVDYTHPDLTANIWQNPGEIPGNGIDDDSDGYIDDIYGCDTGDNDSDPMDDSEAAGHGTILSGIIGAVGHNARGVTGVCWDVSIMAIKIADSNGILWVDAAIDGIQYAITKGARVINASWGGYATQQDTKPLYDAIAAAQSAGIIFVAAAGNENINNDTYIPPNIPSSYNLNNIIAVMATSNTDSRAYYSNYGLTSVDIAAPGGAQEYDNDPRGILSTLPGNQYGFFQGTSLACPYVAGACALFLSADASLTYTEVKQFLLDYSDPISSLTGLCVSGGRLNIFNALYEIVYDTVSPLPDPAEWEIVSQATGLHTIAMKAREATDRSGVEYFFECVTDAAKNSEWQDSVLYERGDFNENTTYTFRVKYRDKSEFHNETEWSTEESTTTASGSDNLAPFPSPSRWKIKPRLQRLLPSPRIRMEAMTSTDENGPVEYYFRCIDVNSTGPNPAFDSGWISTSIYTISSGLTVGYSYTFTVKTRDAVVPTPNEAVESDLATVTVHEVGEGNVLSVPAPYDTIQSAIDHASDGDIVVVRPYPIYPFKYTGSGNYNIDFKGKAIIVRSLNPNDPNTVAATIIDCQEMGRAFVFHLGEGHNSVVTGFTIINGSPIAYPSWRPGFIMGTIDGQNGIDAQGGAIACFDGGPLLKPSEPIISYCVIKNCVAAGQYGGHGGDAYDGSNGTDGAPGGAGGGNGGAGNPGGDAGDGGAGGAGGSAFGGAMYFQGGNPEVRHCQISNCIAIGGDAGTGGNGGDGGDGGNGGDGGSGSEESPNGGNGGGGGKGGTGGKGGDGGYGGEAYGGAMYYGSSCTPKIVDCEIKDCNTINGLGTEAGDGGDGGNGGDGGGGGTPAAGGVAGNDGSGGRAGDGGNGGVADYDGLHSWAGAIYYENNCQVTIINTTIKDNMLLINDGGFHHNGNGGAPGAPGESPGGQPGPDGTPGSGLDIYGKYNRTDLCGGGNYYEYNSTTDIIACTISDNDANGQNHYNTVGLGGGEFYELNCVPVFNYCKLEDNLAGVDGGGIYFNNQGSATLNFCNVSGNAASFGAGGGIYGGDVFGTSLDFTVNVYDSNFSGNDALFGGGIYLEETLLTIEDSSLSGNTAFEGAAVWDYNCVAIVKDCTVMNNSASLAGGFSVINGLAVIENSVMTGNSADDPFYGTGGGVFFEGWSDYPHQIINCLITDNTAYAYGAGLSNNRGSWVEITNSTIVDNKVFGSESVGGGVSCAEHWAWVDIFNSILWGNEAMAGGSQIAVGSPYGSYPDGNGPYADVDVSYSDVQGGETGVWLEDETQTFTALWWWGGNIDEDPLFASIKVDEQAYFLSQIAAGQLAESLCVNAGLGLASDLESSLGGKHLTTRTDFVSDVNTNNDIDMGYHYEVGIAKQYLLTIEVVNSTGGSLSAQGVGDDSFTIAAPGTRLVKAGTVVSLQALADAGYAPRWTGTDDDTSADPNNTVTMNSDKSVRVEFYQYTLTIEVYTGGDFEPNGTLIASNSLPTDPFSLTARDEPNSRPVTPGIVVDLTAIADPDYRLWWWSGTDDDALTAATNTVTMNSDKTVAVAFEPDGMYYLIVHVIGEGTVTPPGRTLHVPGEVVTLTAIPDNPSDIVIWSGTDDDLLSSANNTVTMNTHKEVTVEFYAPQVLNVPGDYSTVQEAVDAADNGDHVIIAPGTYTVSTSVGVGNFGYAGILIFDKKITIRSMSPDDPCVVSSTIITTEIGPDGYTNKSGFIIAYVGPQMVLNGITINGVIHRAYGGLDADDPLEDGGNGAHAIGGGILCIAASPTIRNCIISNCEVIGGNGGNGLDGGGSEFTDPNINGTDGGWPGRAYGGGLACLRWYSILDSSLLVDSNPTVINCTFRNCEAVGGDGGDGGNGGTNEEAYGDGGRGGGWYYNEYSRWYNVPWDYSSQGYLRYGPDFNSFYDFYAEYTGRGGAVFVGEDCSPTFTHCTFINNRCDGGTCGICGLDGWPPQDRTEPSIPWKIESSGGALFCEENSSPTFVDCTFTGNTADTSYPEDNDDPYVSRGGAVAGEANTNVTFENCNFTSNLASIGGAIYSSDATAEILDCNVLSNSAYLGGGLFVIDSCFAAISRSNFIDNAATSDPVDPNVLGEGGGMHLWATNADITDCIITGNQAGASGGGVFIGGEGTPSLFNCLVTNNTAGRDGGGVSTNIFSQLNISNCTIADNMGWGLGGGVYCSYSSYTNILDSILWGNTGINGSQIAVGSSFEPSTVDILYSDLGGTPVFAETDPINANGLPVIRPGFDTQTLAANDDLSTGIVDIGFEINFFGDTYSTLYVNNNGNVTFDANMWTYTPWGLTTNIGTPIIAPFFADIDTRVGNITLYGQGTIDGRDAFGVTWIEVGYFNMHTDKLNTLQLILIDRSDRRPGDFDIEFNYGQIQWETGDASEGTSGFGGYSARVGFSNGTGIEGTYYEFPGSGVNGAFLDDNPVTGLIYDSRRSLVDGRYIFSVYGGLPELLEAVPIFVEADCTLNGWDLVDPNTNTWEPNSSYYNINEDPYFVSGYYLSQIAAGQPVESNCVDAGSDAAANLGLDVYTTRTDRMTDDGIVDMGFHYPFSAWVAPSCGLIDLSSDGIVNFKDFAIFASNWLDEGCSSGNDWCLRADLTFDTRVDLEDLLMFVECWLVEDIDPPIPNPSEWAVAPYSVSTTSISMTAQIAIDMWGGDVEYYFDCYSGSCTDSGWQDDPNYTNFSLSVDTEYGYRVRTRDIRGNTTGWSLVRYATTGEEPVVEDQDPPTPDPMTWASVPTATGPTTITMTATTATDDTLPVTYFFECTSDGSASSNWQAGTTYTATDLTPETEYTFRVRARDGVTPTPNITGWSTDGSATTPEEGEEPEVDTNPPTPVMWEITPYETGGGQDAYANMTAAEATDPEGNGPVEYYFECDHDSLRWLNSGWTENRQWNNVYIGPSGGYLMFHFKVRDNADPRNESNWSTSLPCVK